MEMILGLFIAYILHIAFCLFLTNVGKKCGYVLFSSGAISIPIALSFVPVVGVFSIILALATEFVTKLMVSN